MPIVGQDVPGLRARDLRGLQPPRLLVLDARAADDRGRVPVSEWSGNDMSDSEKWHEGPVGCAVALAIATDL